jgi:hypothetical protein
VLCSQYGRTVNGTTAYVAGSTRSLSFPIESAYPITAYLPVVTFIYDACIPRY